MTNFTEKQLKELLASAISSDMAQKHIVPLTGKPALDTIFYALTSEYRRNDGRVRDKLLKQYDPIFKHGGLAFHGYHPITGERTECLSFKPNQPLESGRKYEQPPNSDNQAFYPYVDALRSKDTEIHRGFLVLCPQLSQIQALP